MRKTLLLAAVVLVCPTLDRAQEHQHEHALTEQELGSVRFATTCANGMAAEDAKNFNANFNHAVALLHSFQYEQSRAAFTAITRLYPTCAMAHWGIAMSHYHGLWGNSRLDLGRAALEKAHETASANPTTSARENGYIEALGEIYAQDGRDAAAHAQAFERKMGELAARNPSDTEAKIFHALALKLSASRTDKSFANDRKCGEILEPIFKQQPHHPGVAHYIIHCYDNPALAERGLDAARLYAKIAPASAHANHMPSHIFTRVGAWPDSISSNLQSAKIAEADEHGSKTAEPRDQRLHAMDYLEYAYLQTGQLKEAMSVMAEMNALTPVAGLTLTGDYALAAIPTRYAFERNDWTAAAALAIPNLPHWSSFPFMEALIEYGHALGRAHIGDLDGAQKAIARMGELRDATKDPKFDYFKSHLDLQMQAASAWVAAAEGKKDDAVDMLRRAADSEDILGKHPVSPGAFVPIREQIGTILLEVGKPTEAQREFEAALKIYPGRFRGLYGAARAAELAGDNEVANRYYTKLAAQTSKAGGSRNELNHVREFLSAQAKRAESKGVAARE